MRRLLSTGRLLVLLAAAVACSVSVAGCDAYEPTGEPPPTEIDATPRAVDIALTAADDTLGLWGTVDVTYALADDDLGRVREVRVALAGRTYTAAPGTPIRVPTAEIADGLYRLVLQAVAASGTGSLADVYGRETVVVETERTVAVDNAPPTPVAVRSLAAEGGLLTVRWGRYPRRNFQGYRLYRLGASGTRTLVTSTDDVGATAWADSLFIGGGAAFVVETLAGGRRVSGAPATAQFEPPGFVEGAALDPTRTRLSWTATEFPGAFGAYVIEQKGPPGLPPVTTRVTGPSDTTLVAVTRDVFGATYEYTIRTENGVGRSVAGSPIAVPLDASAPVASVSGYAAQAGAFVGLSSNQQSLVRIDASTFRVTASIGLGTPPYGVHVSPGSLALSWVYGGEMRLVDVSSFTTVSRFDQQEAYGPYIYPGTTPGPNEPRLTDDGLYISSFSEPTGSSYRGGLGVIALDAVRGRIAARLDAPVLPAPAPFPGYQQTFLASASPDGRHVVALSDSEFSLYERTEAGEFSRIGIVKTFDPANAVAFNDVAFVGNDRLSVTEPALDEIRVFEVPSLQEVSRFSAGGLHSVTYDPGSGVVYGRKIPTAPAPYSAWEVVGYDVRTGDQVFAVQTIPVHGQVELYGGVLWSGGTYRRVVPAR